MSLSNILLSNNPVTPQPWTNLTCSSLACNSLTCNSLSVTSPIFARYPTTPETLNIAAADQSVTTAITFNFASNPYPDVFDAGTGPSINIKLVGKYLVNIDLSQIEMSAILNSYGAITAVLKAQPPAGYQEIAEQTQNISDTVSGSYSITKIVDIPAPNTNIQVLFRRDNAAAAAGAVVVPVNSASGCSLYKLA